jgi:hypothetical protein
MSTSLYIMLTGKLDCIVGKVTQKAMDHMKRDAEQKENERSQSEGKDPEVALDKHRYISPSQM